MVKHQETAIYLKTIIKFHIMKTKIFYLMLATAAVFACNKPEEEIAGGKAAELEIVAEKNYDRPATKAEDVSFEIFAKNTTWTVTVDKDWCTVEPAEGKTDAEVVITVADNETADSRTATVTVKAEGVKDSQSFTITQAGKSAFSVVEPVGMIPSEGGNKTFTVTSNIAWTASSDSDWLTLDKTSGTPSADAVTVTATAEPNTGAARKAVVTVKAGTNEKTFEIRQDMMEVKVVLKFAPLSDEQKEQLISYKGETVTYAIEGDATAAEWEVVVSTPFEENCGTVEYTKTSASVTFPSSQFAAPGYVTLTLKTNGEKTDELKLKQDSWFGTHSSKSVNIEFTEDAKIIINPGPADNPNSIVQLKERISMGSIVVKVEECTISGAKIGYEAWEGGQMMAYLCEDGTFSGNIDMSYLGWPNLNPVGGPALDEITEMSLSMGRPADGRGSFEFAVNKNRVAGLPDFNRPSNIVYEWKPTFGLIKTGENYAGKLVINRVIITPEGM